MVAAARVNWCWMHANPRFVIIPVHTLERQLMKRKRAMGWNVSHARARSRVTSHKESLHDETHYATEVVNVDACSITRDYLLFLYIPPFLRRSRVYDGSLGQDNRNESTLFFTSLQFSPIYRSDGESHASIPAIPFKLPIAVARR